MNEVEYFLEAMDRARRSPTRDNLLQMVEKLSPFSPPGLEWGIELSFLAGVTYMLEDGRLLMVRVSRDEFGPFMQTSVTQISLQDIPDSALKPISDVDTFIAGLLKHLNMWLNRAPVDHPRRRSVEMLVQALEENFSPEII
ncbi:MAG: hypothetical protein QW756_04005 [Nitrososphaerota archaeon]